MVSHLPDTPLCLEEGTVIIIPHLKMLWSKCAQPLPSVPMSMLLPGQIVTPVTMGERRLKLSRPREQEAGRWVTKNPLQGVGVR